MAIYGRMLEGFKDDDYEKGLRLFDQGLYEAAILELEKVVDNGDLERKLVVKLAAFYLAECWSFLGSYALGQRLFDRAAECFTAALKRNPGYADLHYKLSTVYYMQDRLEEASREVALALAINPRYSTALVHSALCKYRSGRPAAALESIKAAVKADGSLHTDCFITGIQAHVDGDYETALHYFTSMVVADVDDVARHARLGSDYFRQGKLEQASEEFMCALQINPNYADLHNSLGMTYHLGGKYLMAAKEFKTAIAINPGYDEAIQNLQIAMKAAVDAGVEVVHLELLDDTLTNEAATGR